MRIARSRLLLFLSFAALFLSTASSTAGQRALTREEAKEFLVKAPIVDARPVGRGITSPWRLTLEDGTLRHDAAFQGVDERRTDVRFADGRREMMFRDSYHFNLAAYALAELLALDQMMPVTVPRTWRGRPGALSWWIDVQFDEGQRRRDGIQPPDPVHWSDQLYRMRVFEQLVHDIDRNLGNILIDRDWQIWMIDFTRAFRLQDDRPNPQLLQRCDRGLLERLRSLDVADVRRVAGRHLSSVEIRALMRRREKLVQHFDALIAERGEASVLY